MIKIFRGGRGGGFEGGGGGGTVNTYIYIYIHTYINVYTGPTQPHWWNLKVDLWLKISQSYKIKGTLHV